MLGVTHSAGLLATPGLAGVEALSLGRPAQPRGACNLPRYNPAIYINIAYYDIILGGLYVVLSTYRTCTVI